MEFQDTIEGPQALRRPVAAPGWSRALLAGGVLALVSLAAPGRAAAQASVSVQTNRQLFTVLCALHAAGYEEDVGDTGFHRVRARLRLELLRLQGPAVQAVRQFYRNHRVLDPAANLSRYVSLALQLGPPPKFEITERREALPPDVLVVQEFAALLPDFYREARIEEIWRSVQAEYDREALRLRGPIGQLVLETTSYLREIQRLASGRSFTIDVEPMVGAKTSFRNYGDRYFVVMNPAGKLPLADIRHSYLHFLLDALPGRYRREVALLTPLQQYAARAPRLPAEWRNDWQAFLTECLVRVVELRLQKLTPKQYAAAIDAAERDGFILARAFDRGMTAFDNSEPAMTFYFQEMLAGVDVAAEAKRLETVQFAAADPSPAHASAEATALSKLETLLAEGDRQIARQNAAGAVATFGQVLEKYPGESRAKYGLAVALILRREVERAKTLLQELVEQAGKESGGASGLTPAIVAWSHVHLGRIYDVEENRELAPSEYRAALAVAGAPEAARAAAQKGMARGYEPGRPDKP